MCLPFLAGKIYNPILKLSQPSFDLDKLMTLQYITYFPKLLNNIPVSQSFSNIRSLTESKPKPGTIISESQKLLSRAEI